MHNVYYIKNALKNHFKITKILFFTYDWKTLTERNIEFKTKIPTQSSSSSSVLEDWRPRHIGTEIGTDVEYKLDWSCGWASAITRLLEEFPSDLP